MENYFDKIQDYLDGELTSEELAAFEQALQNDPELQRETALRTEMQAVIKRRLEAEKGVPALRQTLKNTGVKPKAKVVSFRRVIIGMAAAAAIIAVVVMSGILSDNRIDLPRMEAYVSRGAATDSLYNAAVDSYNDKDYAGASLALEQVLSQDSSSSAARYYLGLSYVGNKAWGAAVTHLARVSSGTSIYAGDAAYFAAVCYKELDNKPAARERAEKVPSASPYYKKAQKLLDGL